MTHWPHSIWLAIQLALLCLNGFSLWMARRYIKIAKRQIADFAEIKQGRADRG